MLLCTSSSIHIFYSYFKCRCFISSCTLSSSCAIYSILIFTYRFYHHIYIVVLVKALQRNRTNKEIYEEIYYGQWLMWLWRLKYTIIYYLQFEESEKPVWHQRPEKHGGHWCKSWVKRPANQELQCRRAGGNGCPRLKRENLPFLCFLFYSGPWGLGDAHPHWWGCIFFTQSSDSNANCFQKHLHRHTQK